MGFLTLKADSLKSFLEAFRKVALVVVEEEAARGAGSTGRREVPILHPAGNGCEVLPVALAAGEWAEEDQAQRIA